MKNLVACTVTALVAALAYGNPASAYDEPIPTLLFMGLPSPGALSVLLETI